MSRIIRKNSSTTQSRIEKSNFFAPISILIVDDDTLIPTVTRNVLESFGFKNIYLAKTARTALHMLEHKKIDLIITEWPMQPASHTNLVRHIRQQNKSYRQIPIILLTAKSDLRTVRTARNDGMTEFLVKPFRVDTLCDRITRVIEKPREFVFTKTYVGPDRRRKTVKFSPERRADALEQEKNSTRKGNLRIIQSEDGAVIVADKDLSLQKKIGFESKLSDIFTPEAIAAAEAIIDESSNDFTEEVSRTLQAIEQNLIKITADPNDMNCLENISWNALDIKAKSGVFKFPLASQIAKSLHDYIDGISTLSDHKIAVIKEHFSALKVIFHQKLRIDATTDQLAGKLLSYLQKLTQHHSAHDPQ